jgi:hypothetical protein
MVDDNPKDPSRETFERLIEKAKEVIENSKELLNRLPEPQPENADPQRKLSEPRAVPTVSRAPRPPTPLSKPAYRLSRPKFRPLGIFNFSDGYPEPHRARVRLAELEAAEMDQTAGIREIMAPYLAGVRECGTRAENRWSADQVQTDISRFLRHVAISQGRTQGIWNEPDDEVEKAVREMPEYRAAIRDVCEAWIAREPTPPLPPPQSDTAAALPLSAATSTRSQAAEGHEAAAEYPGDAPVGSQPNAEITKANRKKPGPKTVLPFAIQSEIVEQPEPEASNTTALSQPATPASPAVAAPEPLPPDVSPLAPSAPAAISKKDKLPKPLFPKRAAWLRERLAERKWNERILEQCGGPEHRTTQKILNAFSVGDAPLHKVVDALSNSKAHPTVTFQDIPQD